MKARTKHKAIAAALKKADAEFADIVRGILDPQWTPAERRTLVAHLMKTFSRHQLEEYLGPLEKPTPKTSRKSAQDFLSDAIKFNERAKLYERERRPADAKRWRAKAAKAKAEGEKRRLEESRQNSN